MHVDHFCVASALDYKFVVRSVDPDEVTSENGKDIEPDLVPPSNHSDSYEEGQEEGPSSPAPVILGENGTLPNSTGNDRHLNISTNNRRDWCPSPLGQTHRRLRCHRCQSCSAVLTDESIACDQVWKRNNAGRLSYILLTCVQTVYDHVHIYLQLDICRRKWVCASLIFVFSDWTLKAEWFRELSLQKMPKNYWG